MDPFSVYAPITVLDTNGYKVDPAQYLIEPPSNGGYPDYGRDFFNSLLTERWIPAHGRLVPAVLTSKDGIYALQPADPIPNPYIDPKEDPLKPIDAKQLQMSDYDIHFQDYETFARDYEPPVDLGLWGNVARAHDRRMGYILRPDGFLCPCPASGPLLRFEKPVRFDRIRLGHCISLYDADDDWYDANARDADAIDPRGTMIPRELARPLRRRR
ncbi:uncharacterized protein B0H18DRAFT_47106 [Fomitopsis serialis]|uniref:uncharacterized protein n=1 Tax=Fomitopsis serialis TaxID=139415 RepID=UPI0020088372|nr:uncharacterized protein B0H18DRAFT_47106 [Neoantrodia serialis]KAH9917022.1 hypothetical protein B0H18DRAFT_47106 [Neoantrodia serialis]